MKNTRDFDGFMSEHVNINQSRLDRLNSGVRGVSEHLGKNLKGFQKVERQGSYALRTITKPVNDHEYDADILLYVDYVPGKAPCDYIEDVYQCMKQNLTYAEKVHRKSRCVVVDYAGDFHLDVVPCLNYKGRQFICNRKTNDFEPTDGTGYRDWFNAKNSITSGNLKRVTRLFKYLRDHKQTFTAPSILLTTLIGNAVYDSDAGDEFRTLPDALRTISNRINDFLQANQVMPVIQKPGASRGRLREALGPDQVQPLQEHVRQLHPAYQRIIRRNGPSEERRQMARPVRRWLRICRFWFIA